MTMKKRSLQNASQSEVKEKSKNAPMGKILESDESEEALSSDNYSSSGAENNT